MVIYRHEIYVGEMLWRHHIFDGVYARHLADELKAEIKQDGKDPSIVKIRVIQTLRTSIEKPTKIYYI
jgi:hypothetical protein